VVWAPTIDLAAIRSRWRGLPFVHVCATALSLTPLDLVVWAKANAGAGNLYRSRHELLPLFTSEINNYPRLPLVGTKRTCRPVLTMSVDRVKSDLAPQGRDFRIAQGKH
jgi:hypothetical protein